MKKLILTILLMSGMQAYAGNDGGGGGGFCVNKQCVTLAESGFRFVDTEKYPEPVISSELFEEVKLIYSTVNKSESLMSSVLLQMKELTIGKNDSYIRVEKYDAEKFKKYKDEYLKILTKNSYKTEGFELFAVSDADRTYLLPSFDKLSKRSKALILVHEGLVRWAIKSNKKLESVLKVDIGLLDTLKGKSNFYSIAEGAYELGLRSVQEARFQIGSYLLLDRIYQTKSGYYNLSQRLGNHLNGWETTPDFLSYVYEQDKEIWNYLKKYKPKEVNRVSFEFALGVLRLGEDVVKNYKEKVDKVCKEDRKSIYIYECGDIYDGNGPICYLNCTRASYGRHAGYIILSEEK